MGQPYLDQLAIRFGNNDGTGEGDHTWIALANTAIDCGAGLDIETDETFIVRFVISNNAGAKNGELTPQIEYAVNGGSWANVGAATPVYYTSTSVLTDGNDSTQRVGVDADYLTNNNWVIEGDATGPATTLTTGYEAEVVVCLRVDLTQFNNGDYVQLKVTNNGADIDNYTNLARIDMTVPVATTNQSGFRFTSVDGTLASPTWKAAANTNVSLGYGVPFQVWIEIEETAGAAFTGALQLAFQKNGTGGYTALQGVPYGATQSNYPVLWGVVSDNYAHGDAITSNPIAQSAKTFTNGHGVEDTTGDVESNSITINNQCTVLAFTVYIPHAYDAGGSSPLWNNASDYFDFRLQEADNTALDAYGATGRVTVLANNKHIGATTIETPNRIGPFKDGNDNLYFFTEATDNANVCCCLKSTDNGLTWTEVDGANRPTTTDIECMDVVQRGSTLHYAIHHTGSVTYGRFLTSDDGSNPDTWAETDTSIATVNTAIGQQAAALEVFSNGNIVLFYNIYDTGTTYDKGKYKIYTGTWGSEQDLEVGADDDVHFISCCIDTTNNLVHVFYKSEDQNLVTGPIWHKSLSSAFSLSAREQVVADADETTNYEAAMTVPVFWTSGGEEKVMIVYIEQTNRYGESVLVVDDGTPETASTISTVAVRTDSSGTWGSRSGTDALVVNGTKVYYLYADAATGDLWIDVNDDEGGWGTDTEIQDGKDIQWVMANVYTRSGSSIIGYVYDNGSDGYVGFQWFDEYALSTTYYQSNAGAETPTGAITLKKTLKALAGSVTDTGAITLRRIFKALAGAVTDTGTIATLRTAFASLAGAETDTGAITLRKVFKALSGAETPTGAITLRRVFKALSGAVTDTGTLIKKTIKTFAGEETDTGTVATQSRFTKALAGAVTDTGAITLRRIFKALAGSETDTGAITLRRIFKSLAGSVTDAGAITLRRIFKALSGSTTDTGTVATQSRFTKALAGAVTDTGAITLRRIFKALSGSETSTGSLVKKTIKTLVGAVTDTGTVDAVKQAAGKFYQSLAGATTDTGELVKKTSKSLAGAVTDTGDLIKKMFEALTGVETDTGSVSTVRTSFVSLAGIAADTGAITLRRIFKALLGATNDAGTLTKKTSKSFAGSVTDTGGIIKKTFKKLVGQITAIGALVTNKIVGGGSITYQSLDGAETPTGSVSIVWITLSLETHFYNVTEWQWEDYFNNPENYRVIPAEPRRVVIPAWRIND